MLKVESHAKINITETEPGKFSGGFIMIGFPVGEILSTPLGPDKEHPEKAFNKTDSNGKKIDYTALYLVRKSTMIHDRHTYAKPSRANTCN